MGPFTFSFIAVKGLIQSPLFLENFISSDYDTLAVQRESESGIERYATTTCRISSILSIRPYRRCRAVFSVLEMARGRAIPP